MFDYRQKVTRSFEYLQGDYYIAPLFMVKIHSFTIVMLSLDNEAYDNIMLGKVYFYSSMQNVSMSLLKLDNNFNVVPPLAIY